MNRIQAFAPRFTAAVKIARAIFLCGYLSYGYGNAFAQTAPAAAASPTPAPAPAASAAPATPTQSAVTGTTGNHNEVYADRIPSEQMITLDANGDKFQARHIPDLSGLPRGAIIILHDSGQHPTWPFTNAALIDDLPLHGWDTLNIELPTPISDSAKTDTPNAATPAAASTPATPAAPSTPAAANAATPAQTAVGTAIEPQAQARINAAIKYYADQNQRNIALIGFGSGAIRAAENLHLLVATKTTSPADAAPVNTEPLTALVMIAATQKLNGVELDLPHLLPLTGIATLDMTLDSEPQARAEAEERRRAVLHQRTRIYTRLELPPLNDASDAQHSTMVKRVRSWLQKNANAKPLPEKQQVAAPS